jgi:cytochrome c biogenesis protein CcdA
MSDAVTLLLLAGVVGLLDSLNPATVLPALFLATGPNAARRTLSFAFGILAVNLLGGVALLAGPGRVLRGLLPQLGALAQHLAELGLAVALLAGAFAAWHARDGIRARSTRSRAVGGRAPLLLGATIAIIDLPTAIPYFGVIAALTAARASLPVEAVALCVFNAAFLAPVLGIALLARVSSSRLVPLPHMIRALVLEHGGAVLAGILTVAAMVLLVVGGLGMAR